MSVTILDEQKEGKISDCVYYAMKSCTKVVSEYRPICQYHEGMFGLFTKKVNFYPKGTSFSKYETYALYRCDLNIPFFINDGVVNTNEIESFFERVKLLPEYSKIEVKEAKEITKYLLTNDCKPLTPNWLLAPDSEYYLRNPEIPTELYVDLTCKWSRLYKILFQYVPPCTRFLNLTLTESKNIVNNLNCIFETQTKLYTFKIAEQADYFYFVPKDPDCKATPLVLYAQSRADPTTLDENGEYDPNNKYIVSTRDTCKFQIV